MLPANTPNYVTAMQIAETSISHIDTWRTQLCIALKKVISTHSPTFHTQTHSHIPPSIKACAKVAHCTIPLILRLMTPILHLSETENISTSSHLLLSSAAHPWRRKEKKKTKRKPEGRRGNSSRVL